MIYNYLVAMLSLILGCHLEELMFFSKGYLVSCVGNCLCGNYTEIRGVAFVYFV